MHLIKNNKMSNTKKLLCYLFLLLFASSGFSQSLEYNKSIDDCYSTVEFRKERYKYKHEHECYIGLRLPEFEMLTMDGELINNESFKGKITVINFWFAACPPCIAEIPGLSTVSKKYSNQNINFIAASTDSYDAMERFLRRKGSFGFEVAPNTSDIFFNNFHIQSGFPTTIIVDEQGVIQYFITGGLADFRAARKIRKKLSSAIDKMLKESQEN